MRSGSYEPVGSKASLFLFICIGVLIKKIAMNLPALIQSQWSNFLNHTIRILLVKLMASSPCSIYVPFIMGRSRMFDFVFFVSCSPEKKRPKYTYGLSGRGNVCCIVHRL